MNEETYFADFKKLLIDFFRRLSSSEEVWTGNKGIYNSSMSLCSKLKSTGSDSWYLSIDPPWVVWIIDDDYFEKYGSYLVIGGEIEVNNHQFKKFNFYFSIVRNSHSSVKSKSGYLSCCEEKFKDKSRIVRRFHFDTGEGNPEILEARSHMQFGGICREQEMVWKIEGVDLHYCLDNKMRIPRFPYPPIDIIVLLDILLRQFRTSIDKRFVEKSEWLRLVRRSEDFRLNRYFQKINEYFAQKGKEESGARPKTLFEFLCEKECVF